MRKLLTAIAIMLTTIVGAQIKTTNTTAPDFNDGSITIDTTGTNIKAWAIYRVVDGVRVEKALGYNVGSLSNLSVGAYWILGKKPNDNNSFSLEKLVYLTVRPKKDCDSVKLSNFNTYTIPDPMNPNNPPKTCLSHSLEKAAFPVTEKIYTQDDKSHVPVEYYGPNMGGCIITAPNTNIFMVFTDANGCQAVADNYREQYPTNYPTMGVPGTEPGPITNHVTIGVVDCSGYYIHYNNTQYKICNSGAARVAKMVHLDSIVVAGKFVNQCDYQDTMVFCQMYHPYTGYFWVDSIRNIGDMPKAQNCWDNYQLDQSYNWTNLGKKPTIPTDTNYTYAFDDTSCAWLSTMKKDSTMGVNEINTNKISACPNPFIDNIRVKSEKGSYGTITSVEGRTIRMFDGGDTEIDTKDLNPGTYFLNITRNRKSSTIKITKQ